MRLGWLAGVLVVAVAAHADKLPWHRNRAEAFAAAKKSGQPVMLYLFVWNNPQCQKLETDTLIDSESVRAARDFECGVVDAQKDFEFPSLVFAPEFLRPRTDAQGHNETPIEAGVRVQEYLAGLAPMLFFFTPDRRELYRVEGVVKAAELAGKMGIVRQMAEAMRGDAENKDPVAQAQIGHAYVELEVGDAPQPYLARACRLDPDNKLGARENAELDLAISTLQRDRVEQAIELLQQFLSVYSHGQRACEARFQLAMALFGAGQTKQAEQLWREIGDVPPGTAKDKSCADTEWGKRARAVVLQLDRKRGAAPPAGREPPRPGVTPNRRRR
jgi:hypothetical protein